METKAIIRTLEKHDNCAVNEITTKQLKEVEEAVGEVKLWPTLDGKGYVIEKNERRRAKDNE